MNDRHHSATPLRFEVDGHEVELRPEVAIVAGYTARDTDELQRHIAELKEEGVPAPSEVPSFYVVPPTALTQDSAVDVVHAATSGEAEIVLLVDGQDTFVTLASDHTDRRAETLDIAVSKRACPKPVARSAWRFRDVAGTWDDLELRSWIQDGGQRVAYQDGRAGTLLSPGELLAKIPFSRRPKSFALLTGTLPALGGMRFSDHFWAQLLDRRSGRVISLDYGVRLLDVLDRADA